MPLVAFGGQRSVVVSLDARVSGYVAQMGVAAKATADVARQAQKSATDHKAAWDDAGKALLGFGAVAVGAVALATREAIAWESAWAGVRKTVDGSDVEMASLEAELRNLAKTLPATHEEIAAVAEAAGQLGVKREAIVDFTRTMIALGETTNLTADEAATAIARMANIMGTSQGEVDRLGASLVALGNDGAATEREILDMALRIAGAGKTIGLTEGEVLGFANALSSLGIEAEAGGTAISRVMLEIGKSVDVGGDSLAQFARVAGMSAEDFAAAFRDRPAEAISAFVAGLARIQAEGGNTTQVMDDLGLGEIRVSDALRRLSSNSELLADSLGLGNQAWEENTALVAEAAKRYDTTASQIQVAQNQIRDAAITAGEAMLPVAADLAEAVAGIAEAFGSIPAPVMASIVQLTAMAGVLALAGGAFLTLVPKIAATQAAMATLASTAPTLAAGLTAVQAALLPLAVAMAGTTLAQWAAAAAVAQVEAEALAEDLLRMAAGAREAGPALASIFETGADWSPFRTEIETTDDAVQAFAVNAREALGDSFWEKLDRFTGGGTDLAEFREQVTQLDKALAAMVEGGQADAAAELMERFTEAAVAQGVPISALQEQFPLYNELLAQTGAAATGAAGGADTLTTGIGGMSMAAQDAETSFDALSDALDKLLGDTFSVEEATDRFEQGLLDLAEAAKRNGTEIDGNSQAALRNREQMRASVADAAGLIDAYARTGASASDVAAFTNQLRQRLYDQAVQAGFSEQAAARYAGALDQIPGIYEATIRANTSTAIQQLDEVLSRIVRLDGRQAVVTVTTRNVQTGRVSVQSTRMEAEGGIVARYAGGGVHHPRVPMVAAGGSNILWGEPEVGRWEAYIPERRDLRPRAVQITRQVAEEFGYQLVPKSHLVKFAAGGTVGMPARPQRTFDAAGDQLHFHLDSAAAAATARAYAVEVVVERRREAAVRGRRR